MHRHNKPKTTQGREELKTLALSTADTCQEEANDCISTPLRAMEIFSVTSGGARSEGTAGPQRRSRPGLRHSLTDPRGATR